MHELDQDYIYSLENCLSHYGSPVLDLSARDVRVRLDVAYDTVVIPNDFFEKWDPLSINAMIASKAAQHIIRNDGIGIFKTLLQLRTDEQVTDERLGQWNDFGSFEDDIRMALMDCLTEERDALAQDIAELDGRKRKWFHIKGPRKDDGVINAQYQKKQIDKIIASLKTKRSSVRTESNK